jgi:hypothetical protein
MDPQYQPQQQPSFQPPANNPYEFIMNPQQPQKPKGFGGGGNLPMILGLVAGGAVVLMIVLALVVNLLGGSKGANTEDFVGLVQSQNELVRVSNQGVKDGIQQSTKSLAVTTEYAMRTQQRETIALLTKSGRVLGEKEPSLKQNAKTDQQFTTAKSTSSFDLVFSQVMQNELTTYASNLKALFTKTTNPEVRDQLSDYYEQTQLLISQVPYTQESIESASQ